MLSDVYYPTNDTTNNETLQYVVTDGSTFTDLQTRDMTYTVQALDKRALTCRVVAKAKSGKYRITTDFLTDPSRPSVDPAQPLPGAQGQDTRLQGLRPLRPEPQRQRRRRARQRRRRHGADPGGTVLVGSDTVTATNAANRDYAQPVFSALLRRRLHQVSNGYAGAASDGLKQLDAARS